MTVIFLLVNAAVGSAATIYTYLNHVAALQLKEQSLMMTS